MNEHITNIVRSVVLLGCALPLTFALAGRVSVGTEAELKRLEVTEADQTIIDLRDDLTKACIDYKLSKPDTKLERQAKNDIDEAFDGEVLYNATCNYILK